MLPYYKSLIHDITSPVISLFSVWLGARFGLKNEFYTKELDARLFRLETLSGRRMTALLNISDYLGFIACMVNDGLVVYGAREPDSHNIPRNILSVV